MNIFVRERQPVSSIRCYDSFMSQLERVFAIDKSIRERGGATSAAIAREFEVSVRQVKRDIAYLRDRLGAPVVWNAGKKRYLYTRAWDQLAFADERSLFAFVFLKAIVAGYGYVPVISEQAITLLRSSISDRYAQIADRIRYELPSMEKLDDRIALTLCRALPDESVLSIDYTDAGGTSAPRLIAPLRLLNYSGRWYCLAQDYKHQGDLRMFAVARMRDPAFVDMGVEGAPARLPAPDPAAVEAMLASSYGIFKGAPIGTASLRFYDGAARGVRAQTWHPDQRIEESTLPTGEYRLDLHLPVHDWTEILQRALQAGPFCEVLAPPEFRERWRSAIQAMSARAGLG